MKLFKLINNLNNYNFKFYINELYNNPIKYKRNYSNKLKRYQDFRITNLNYQE